MAMVGDCPGCGDISDALVVVTVAMDADVWDTTLCPACLAMAPYADSFEILGVKP